MFQKLNRKIRNDIYISTCFSLILAASDAQSHIQKTLTVNIHNENHDYTVDGHVLLGISFTVESLATWLSPAMLVILGRKMTLIFGGLLYSLYLISFYYVENVILTYLSSIMAGFSASLVWIAQANYVVLNSEIGNVFESFSLLWMTYAIISNLFGNAVVYFEFYDPSMPIDRQLRLRILSILLVFVFTAVLLLCALPPPIRSGEDEKDIRAPLNEIKKSFAVLMNKTWLCILYIYSGLHLTFLSVIGASMGFSKYLSTNTEEFAPLSGFIQGIGQVAGCLVALVVKDEKIGKVKPILVIGFSANIVAYVIAFLCLPNSSTFTYTDELPSFSLGSSVMMYLVLSNFLIGLGNACVLTEIYQCIGDVYPNDSTPAFSIFKFARSTAAALNFYYSNLVGLHAQIIMLSIFGVLGTISHHCVVRTPRKKETVVSHSKFGDRKSSSSFWYSTFTIHATKNHYRDCLSC